MRAPIAVGTPGEQNDTVPCRDDLAPRDWNQEMIGERSEKKNAVERDGWKT